jgi:thermolysin metallopeptidase-like protein
VAVAKRNKSCSRWLQVGVVTVGLGAAAAAGQGLAIASPIDSTDSAGVSSATGSADQTADSGTADGTSTVDKSTDDKSTANTDTDTSPTATRPDSAQQSVSTSTGDGPTSTLSAQQNSSHDASRDEPTVSSDAERPAERSARDEVPQPLVNEAITERVDETPPILDWEDALHPDEEIDDTADTNAKPHDGPIADSLAPTGSILADDDSKSLSSSTTHDIAARVATVADQDADVETIAPGTTSTAQAAQAVSTLSPIAPPPLDVPPNPVRTLVQSFLGLFGFNPYATGPSSNPFNPIFEAAWGFYRRIETSVAETVFTIFGLRLNTATTPAVDTAVDLLGQTRQLNVVWTDQGYVGYILSDTTRGIAIYQTTMYTMDGPLLAPAKPPGSPVGLGPTGIWDPSAVSAYANMVVVYDYYANMLGQTSFNDRGAAIRITVVDYQLNNAYWYRTYQQFVFGHDFEAALDIIGHEYTHAVIDSVVASRFPGHILGENNQARALEEAYADIMGSLIEGKTDVGEWLVGEDYGCGSPSGCALRNLANPSDFNDPENFLDYDADADADEHYNSTIFSFAAYKMMSNPLTDNVSRDTWANVFYRSLSHLLPGASFAQARTAVVTAAHELGLTTDEVGAINAAFTDVGIPSAATAARGSVLV